MHNNIMPPPAIEQQHEMTLQQKAQKILANINKLKALKKTAKETLNEELERNAAYSEAMEKLAEAKLSVKLSKNSALASSIQAAKFTKEIEKLQEEIKNDSENLNDFVATAYKAGEQMRLFGPDGEQYLITPRFSIRKKHKAFTEDK